MPLNLSAFRFLDDFSFPEKLKYWRVDYTWTTHSSDTSKICYGWTWGDSQPTYYGLVGSVRDGDPAEPGYVPNPWVHDWPEAFKATLPPQYTQRGATFTKTLRIQQQYTRFFGFVIYDPSYQWTMSFYELCAVAPGLPGETKNDKRRFVTRSNDEEANLAKTIENWWKVYKESTNPGQAEYSKSPPVQVSKEEYEAG